MENMIGKIVEFLFCKGHYLILSEEEFGYYVKCEEDGWEGCLPKNKIYKITEDKNHEKI